MADVASPFRTAFPASGVARADRRAALWLLGTLLAYGLVMQSISGASTRSVIEILILFEPIAAATMLALAAVIAVSGLTGSGERGEIETRLFWLIVAGGMTWLMFPFFGMFKQIILPDRGFVWDRTFAHVGRAMFGVSPWTLTHEIFGNVAGARFLDFLYSVWMPLIFAFPQVVAAFVTDSVLRFRFNLCWLASWLVIGSLAAWAFASAGPIYFNALIGPDRNYALLQTRLAQLDRLANAQGHSIAALEFQPLLLHFYRAQGLAPAGGISAMPSMHVAMATLLAIAGFRHNRAWGLLFTAYALLVWTGSVFFGWHYFVDGPVAALMVAGLWLASAPVAKRLYPDRVAALRPHGFGVGSVTTGADVAAAA